MSIGRITGHLLNANLTREDNLAFQTNLLYLDVSEQKIGIKTTTPAYTLDVDGTINSTSLRVNAISPGSTGLVNINSTSALQLPVGNDSQRPSVALEAAGQIRYNTTLQQFEGFYSVDGWNPLASGTGGGGGGAAVPNAIIQHTESLTLTTNWQDTGIRGNTVLANNATYSLQLYADDAAVGGGHSDAYYSGVISWFTGTTLDVDESSILLVCAAGQASESIYLRLRRTINGTLKIQIASSANATGPSTYIFRFKNLLNETGGNITVVNNDVSASNTDGNINLIPNGNGLVTIDSATALQLPSGTELDKLSFTAATGQIRYNSENNEFEGYYTTGWNAIASGTSTGSVNAIVSHTASLTITTDWQDTGVSGIMLPNGSYLMQIRVTDSATGNNDAFYTGTISWNKAETLDNGSSDILLVCAAVEATSPIYARLARTVNGEVSLQIASSVNAVSPATYVFKFKNLLTATGGNIDITNNVISAINTNGNIELTPDGTGFVKIDSTTALQLPSGTEADKTFTEVAGQIRYNSENDEFEGYYTTGWNAITSDSSAAIQSAIDSELTLRTNADTTLQANINSEITARTNADATLQANINAIIPTQTGNNGKYLTTNGSSVSWATVASGAGGSIQWNNNGSFGGDSLLIWDDVNNYLGVNKAVPTAAIDVVGNVVASGNITASFIPTNGAFSFRNKLINGGFQINQRGEKAVANSGINYTADRWVVMNAGSGLSATAGNTVSGGSTLSGYMLYVTGSWTNGITYVQQKIESYIARTLYNKAFTVSLKVYHNFGSNTNFTLGAYTPTAQDNFASYNTALNTVTTTANTSAWTTITLTVPAQTASINNGLMIQLNHVSNTVSSKTFYVADAQVEEGEVATAFEHRPFGLELILCQRYYEKSYEYSIAPGINTGSGLASGALGQLPYNNGDFYTGYTPYSFKVSKRDRPTMAFFNPTSGAATFQNISVNSPDNTVGVRTLSSTGFSVYGVDSTLQLGNVYMVHWTASAEL
jgi:hypothetical protein